MGIDPLEAVFAQGLRRFDKSGEYTADGAVGLVGWLRWKCRLTAGAAIERVTIARQVDQLPKTSAAFASGALGYQHARWGFGSGAEVRRIAAGYRDRGLPLSAIHLDIDHLDGHRVFTVDERNFPGFPGCLIARRHTVAVVLLSGSSNSFPQTAQLRVRLPRRQRASPKPTPMERKRRDFRAHLTGNFRVLAPLGC